jgi:hypothetical protein
VKNVVNISGNPFEKSVNSVTIKKEMNSSGKKELENFLTQKMN